MDAHLKRQLAQLEHDGLYKHERVISSMQAARITLDDGRSVINLCANNYLGLADAPELIAAAHAALDRYGVGMASVRFICGTQDAHKQLEAEIAQWLGTEDAILFPSAFDANGGVFEALLGEEDAIISDALNHASIIDGIRLCKAQRHRYANCDLAELESCLQKTRGARFRMIATDGVFSMDGTIAPLDRICALAQQYDALVMVDDAHAHGVLGATGAGSVEHRGMRGRVQVITGTLGKALGGASGGFVAASRPMVEWLRNRARPYLFSNSVAPALVAAAREALRINRVRPQLRAQLIDNAAYWRAGLGKLGYTLQPGEHPIIPVMLGDAKLAGSMSKRLLELGVYVIGFSYPVVPLGKARIRTQMSAALTRAELDEALAAFAQAGRELGVIR
ncbi:MAG TPA: glycine C-acetyltransferase [Nevskiaceae bacterium]|nr:glycine C-acetyltransferase [Nevskiaceae bacterium]